MINDLGVLKSEKVTLQCEEMGAPCGQELSLPAV